MSLPGATRDWDAATYERVSDNQYRWGVEVLERLDLSGDERVLDAGCGSGRVTAELIKRVPRGRVIAVDASPSMIDKARASLGDDADYVVADLAELELDEPVDAILSTAVFHWVPDHDALFARMHAALHPGGRIEAQCGGEGNIDNLRAVVEPLVAEPPYARYFSGWDGPWNFPGPDATAARLERAGFTEVRCWLERKLLTSDEPRAFLASVSLGSHLQRLPEELRDRFVADVADAMGEPLEVDYVRLNISAVRG
ncbi:MAG: trans-aconitate 2-methyltransferase [Thermoleophilaceae bacterium]|nr:trans-aconitate 2-methyltransferase [Thermoleophilaceae bacterium]